MKPANGHANGVAASQQNHAERAVAGEALDASQTTGFTTDEVKRLVQELEVPFDSGVIDWRVTNTTKNGGHRGQVIPYANQRAYADRLNSLVTPAGWTRKYVIHTSANFERSKDQKTVAKVLVACELTIFGLGSHSATGEEWADDENAATTAEAQAFKRTCACFGLGRYLYDFIGVWVDLDDRKRPKRLPSLPSWATPAGWRKGARPKATSITNHHVCKRGSVKIPVKLIGRLKRPRAAPVWSNRSKAWRNCLGDLCIGAC